MERAQEVPRFHDALDVQARVESTTSPPADLPPLAQPYRSFRDAWAEAGERAYVTDLLRRFEQNVAAASHEAEIDRTYLYKLIRRHLVSP